jgi:demethoxyubiquinone hydroxylase (CLK1/Coq7/Cat5 family)
MRVNHCGEICAQALYQGQALASSNEGLKRALGQAAREEEDHLAWAEQRIAELGGHTSLLNPLWYAGSLAVGFAAGKAGDAWNLGFLKETERQVEAHLQGHLDRLTPKDVRTRSVVEAMQRDEAQHARRPKRWRARAAGIRQGRDAGGGEGDDPRLVSRLASRPQQGRWSPSSARQTKRAGLPAPPCTSAAAGRRFVRPT